MPPNQTRRMAEALFLPLLPTLIVFGVAALLAVAAVVAVRALRRTPRARAAADAERDLAGTALVRLDAAVEELDLEVAFSSALVDPAQAAPLRRARMVAQHARDDAFDEYRALSEAPVDVVPSEIRRIAQRIVQRSEQAIDGIADARAAHAAWVTRTMDAGAQVAGVRTRFTEVRTALGDPDALIAELATRVDESEWTEPAALAARTRAALVEAERTIGEAEESARGSRIDASVPVHALLGRAEAALRRAQAAARALDESHRLARQAAAGVAGELIAARAGVREAQHVHTQLTEQSADPDPDAAEQLGEAIAEAEASIARLEPDAHRRPVATVNELARVRTRLDCAQGDARSAQQRLRGARSALPGTLAAARNAVAHAEAAVTAAPNPGADALVRLAAASEALSAARQHTDPVESLDNARRAMRHAEDATALAAYAAGAPAPRA